MELLLVRFVVSSTPTLGCARNALPGKARDPYGWAEALSDPLPPEDLEGASGGVGPTPQPWPHDTWHNHGEQALELEPYQ